MINMPVEFSHFKAKCDFYNYKAIDQSLDKTPANIYSMRTRNGVKVEIKSTKKDSIYVAGQGLSSEKLTFLKEELISRGMVVVKVNAKHLWLELLDDVLGGFFILVSCIEDIEGIIQRNQGARRLIQTTNYDPFLAIAELIQLVIKTGRSEWLGRGNGTFDAIDSLITVGYSVKGKLQQTNGKNAYREHIVPCTLIERRAIEMYKEGRTTQEVANMIRANLFILKISDEEANTLDNVLSLRTVMPEGWKFGDSVYSRITFANIQLEDKKG